MTDWNAAADEATCSVLGALGPTMLGINVWALSGGPPTSAASWALTGAAFLANAALCGDQEVGYPPLPPGFQEGCTKVATTGALMAQNLTFPETIVSLGFDAHEIVRVEQKIGPDGKTFTGSDVYFTTSPDSDELSISGTAWNLDDANYYIVAQPGQACETPNTPPPRPFPEIEPYQYIDNSTNCTYNLKAVGIVQDTDNSPPGFVFEIAPAAELFNQSGGRIGGCNIGPFIFYKPPGGPGTPILPPPGGPPFPPDDGGEPWWLDLLKKAVPIAAGNIAAKLIQDLFEKDLPPASFTFVAPCNKDASGEALYKTYEMPAQNYQSRVVTQQAVIMEILQQHLNWKTPICFGNEGKGDYRTISFISDESSPDGDGRLRKRFRYRSQSGIGLDGIVDHWKDFTFAAGPVCVQHRGSALGSPQVWAASIDEGKRVIQHAAAEAGIDPNQVGEWSVGGSDNPRYGMPGTMRVNTKGGYYWITSRLGENNRPLVVKT